MFRDFIVISINIPDICRKTLYSVEVSRKFQDMLRLRAEKKKKKRSFATLCSKMGWLVAWTQTSPLFRVVNAQNKQPRFIFRQNDVKIFFRAQLQALALLKKMWHVWRWKMKVCERGLLRRRRRRHEFRRFAWERWALRFQYVHDIAFKYCQLKIKSCQIWSNLPETNWQNLTMFGKFRPVLGCIGAEFCK